MPSWYLKSGDDRFLIHPFHLTTHRRHCLPWATDILHALHRMVSCFINWASHFVFHFFPASSHIQCVYSFAVLSTAIITGCPGKRAFCTVLKVTTKERLENCALLCCYAASSGNSLQTFRDDLSVPSSGYSWPPEMGPTGCPETSVRNYRHTLHNNPEERSSHLLRGGSLSVRPVYAAQFVGL